MASSSANDQVAECQSGKDCRRVYSKELCDVEGIQDWKEYRDAHIEKACQLVVEKLLIKDALLTQEGRR